MDTSNNTQTRLLYDRKGAALQLSISVRTLDYIIAAKGLQTRRIGKKVLIPYTSLKAYAAGNHYEPVTIRSDADAVTSGERCE
jgi:excisionase family DNA binding protein